MFFPLDLSHGQINYSPVPRIILEELKKTFPAGDDKLIAAVTNLTLEIADREWLTIVGPSGSGKTTLLRLIAGLETPEHGHIRFDEEDVTHATPQTRDVAMVFQSHALLPHLTALENLSFGLKLRGVSRPEIATATHQIAELLGIGHCLRRLPVELSGGERQRVALGRALIRRPRILLLDEPFSHLDELLRAQMVDELPKLRSHFAATVICVTHTQTEALALGDRIMVLRKGEVQQVGIPQTVHDHPANRFVAGFIGTPAMNLWHGKVAHREGHLVFVGVEPETNDVPARFVLPLGPRHADWYGANVGRPILLGLRPAAIQLFSATIEPHAADLRDATLISHQFNGTQTVCTVRWQGREITALAAANFTPGDDYKLSVRLDLTRAHVFDAATGTALF